MNLVDIGANLSHESFEHDLNEVIGSARAAGLAHIIVTGTDQKSNEAALQLSQNHPDFFSCTAGFHPHVAESFDEAALASIRKLASQDKCLAIGETGLDFNRNFSSEEAQLKAFELHLQLAAELGLPLFLHQRDAHPEFLTLLQQYREQIVGGVVHCFTDTEEALHDYLTLDMYIGITGWVCDERRGTELQSLVKQIPNDRLLIETDSPYLLPRTIRPKPKTRRNEPKHLVEVLYTLSRCCDRPPEQLASETTENAKRLFGITIEQ
ncbi:MAG: preprotein translocase subunit TatD [Pseudohongiella sp.]|nr:MAG: preprotein translocase subunit TatD [Pseudohongiella sp.]